VLTLFRNNQVTTVFVLALFTVLMRLPALLGFITPDPVPPQGAGQIYNVLFGWTADAPTWSAVISTVFVLGQAILMNWLVNSSRVNPERNWLVPLFYVVVVSSTSSFQFLSPALVAATFFPPMYRLLFSIYKSNEITLAVFDTGLLTATAALFYLPVLWLLPVLLLSIWHVRSLKLREIGVFVAGAFVPGFLGWSWAFLNNQGGVFRRQHLLGLFEFWDFHLPESLSVLVQSGVLLFFFLIVIMGYSVYYHKRLIQIQKYNNLLYWLIFATIFTVVFRNQPGTTHFLIAAISVSTFTALSFQSFKNKAVAELLFITLLGGIFTIMFAFG
jgi:hypothetical protein